MNAASESRRTRPEVRRPRANPTMEFPFPEQIVKLPEVGDSHRKAISAVEGYAKQRDKEGAGQE